MLSVGWTVFVLATAGSAEDRYFRTCTGSCEAEMPSSYVYEHALLLLSFITVPIAIAIWWLTRPSRPANGGPPE